MAFLRDDPEVTGPAVTPERISQVERRGVPAPEAYLDVLRERNGGELVADCCRIGFRSSWAATTSGSVCCSASGPPRRRSSTAGEDIVHRVADTLADFLAALVPAPEGDG